MHRSSRMKTHIDEPRRRARAVKSASRHFRVWPNRTLGGRVDVQNVEAVPANADQEARDSARRGCRGNFTCCCNLKKAAALSSCLKFSSKFRERVTPWRAEIGYSSAENPSIHRAKANDPTGTKQ